MPADDSLEPAPRWLDVVLARLRWHGQQGGARQPGPGKSSEAGLRAHRRSSLFGAIISMALVCSAVLIVPSAVAAPRPTLKQVEKRVEALQLQAEQASEQYNETKIRLKSINVRLSASQKQLAQQRVEVDRARQQVGRLASETYRRGQLSTLDLVLGDDPDSALAQAGYLPSLGERQVGAMNRLKVGEQQLAATQLQIQAQKRNATKAQTNLRQSKDAVNRKLAEANAELHKLKASQRKVLISDEHSLQGGTVPGGAGSSFCTGKAANAPSAAAKTAIQYACSQLGDSYVWGADGPSHFDCSGLTMRAYGAAGISLPHSSRMQANYGTRVSVSSLQPGDLIFFYSPISHVAIYLGDGLMVHAPHTGDVVRVASVYHTPTAAVRF